MFSPLRRLLRWFNLHPLWKRLPVRVWGAALRAPMADRWLALRLHQWRLMGVADKRFLESNIQPGMTVVDIGANQGLYSLLFARLAGPAGQVLAFEPDDLLHAALRENVAANSAANVQTFHVALGARAGAMTLYRSLLNSGDNRLAERASGAGPREAVSIRVVRLDEAMAGRRVHFIKMDVQGWEMEVFRGMTGLLDDPQNARMAIYFEFWPQGLRDAGSEPEEILSFLSARGFELRRTIDGELWSVISPTDEPLTLPTAGQYTNLYALRGSCPPGG